MTRPPAASASRPTALPSPSTWCRPRVITSAGTAAMTAASDQPDVGAQDGPALDAVDPAAQDQERDQRSEGVAGREPDADTDDDPLRRQDAQGDQRADGADGDHRELDEERRTRVLVGVERALQQVLGAERYDAEDHRHRRVGDGVGVPQGVAGEQRRGHVRAEDQDAPPVARIVATPVSRRPSETSRRTSPRSAGRGRPAHPREQGGDERHGDQRVRQHEEQEGVVVGTLARSALGDGRGHDPRGDDEAELARRGPRRTSSPATRPALRSPTPRQPNRGR